MAHILLAVLSLIAVTLAQKEQTRWSRQISSYTSDIGDWVPLKVPVESKLPQIKRQAVAEPRILSEPFSGFTRPTGFSQDEFESRAFYNPPANRHLYLQSVPSAPQNYLSDQGFNQGLRFGLTQPNYPLSQGFITPQFNFDGAPQFKTRPQVISNPVKFENVPKVKIPVANPIKPFVSQPLKLKSETPKFVDGYRLENTSNNFPKKKPQSLQKIKFETDKSREILTAHKPNSEREEVQLLYVPLESLNRGQFNFRSPITSQAQLLNTELYNQNTRSNPVVQNFAELQNPVLQQVENFKSQEFISNYSPIREIDPVSKFSTTTTPFPVTLASTSKPKKLKPHQPPLAIFLTEDAKKDDQVKVGDVLYTLKNANTVAVLDSVNPLNSPSVFIGPSSLTPPENYVKFELPYLSNIENTDKKLRQLPFFVAPLSYHTPQGFAKIPFPSPHVGSVVINSQMKDTSSAPKVTINPEDFTNSFTTPTSYKPVQKPVTQKPVISYYSTSMPNINSPNYEQNYYSIEPQAVNPLPSSNEQETKLINQQPAPIKTGSYFLHNIENQQQYNQYNNNHQRFVNFPQETNYKTQEPPRTMNVIKPETTTTQRTTISTTTAQTPPTYPNQLLETHNPYSINQAFSFSTPLEYHNFFDEYKEDYVTPGSNQSPVSSSIPNNAVSLSANPRKPEQTFVNEQSHHSSPNNMNIYRPDIGLPENHNLRYPVFNTNDYFTKTELPRSEVIYTNNSGHKNENKQPITNFQPDADYNDKVELQSPTYENQSLKNNNEHITQKDTQTTKATHEYNQFDITNNSQETLAVGDSSSSTPSTTTTRRTTLRSRARPRYPTPKPDSSEHSTRSTVTRRPLRERKTLPPKSRYEPNKITTERITRKPIDFNESTTKSTRYRTRGRIQFKPSDADDIFAKRNKQNSKEQDLAYQRDVLHQNYPVTLMEKTSTVDIEAITEPSEKENSPNYQENVNTKLDDTEDAYSSDKITITDNVNEKFKDLDKNVEDSQTGASYVPNLPIQKEEFFYQSKTIELPQETSVSNDETKQEEISFQSSAEQNSDNQDVAVTTISNSQATEENVHNEYQDYETQTIKPEELTTLSENEENTKAYNHETSQEHEQEVNIVETTPSYHRVRVRPGVVRKYHQSSSELSRTKTDRRKPLQPITYRPAFDRRRTTMRIEEIEADLKTKQIHTRPEFQNYRQPVYKPEPSTEAGTTSTTESSTKRSQFRRRRPSYGTTSTESTVSRRPYEGKNRFRGRRPTDKTTEKLESQSETTTIKNTLHNRYANRLKFSERYNKNSEIEETTESEDQDPNYSINIPRYMEPGSNGWSPKISKDSFKPFNPNNIANKMTENKSNDGELDIITAKNEYEDILISVTPATNNQFKKKLPEVPPTLEALVKQSKATKGDSGHAVSTFETMLEEVMKSLEEQDENEYTNKVIKHKGGEIGEIPPEIIISSGENYSAKTISPQEESTTQHDNANFNEDDIAQKNRRRGFWKKVKVRPAQETIDVAESQYYSKVVNHVGQTTSKKSLEKHDKGTTKLVVTTYKPDYQFLRDFFESEEDHDGIPDIEITKIIDNKSENLENLSTKSEMNENFTEKISPGEMDLGTGSPDPTFDDSTAYTEPTEPTPSELKSIDRSDGFSFMDYLFGITASDEEFRNGTKIIEEELKATTILPNNETDTETEAIKSKVTTESAYFPYEFTADNGATEFVTEKKPSNEISDEVIITERPLENFENSSKSSFMDPANVISTSMSTEVSHETEICFRGKCIKTNKDVLL